jgi:hypothetical protein
MPNFLNGGRNDANPYATLMLAVIGSMQFARLL